jgi:hypothetical protein
MIEANNKQRFMKGNVEQSGRQSTTIHPSFESNWNGLPSSDSKTSSAYAIGHAMARRSAVKADLHRSDGWRAMPPL